MITMNHTNRHSKIVSLLLLLVLFCLPLSRRIYISTNVNTSEAEHTVTACFHADSDSNQESGNDGGGQIPHCHVLDAPCDTASATEVKYSPLVSQLIASQRGLFFPGYDAPLEIPPKHAV